MPTANDATSLSLHCPRCGYDLSGQAAAWTDHCPLTGTCSECGLELDWITLHHPERLAPRWSIEHAPRLTPLVVLKTAVRALIPWKFWRTLRMEHPIHSGRLTWTWLAVFPFLYLACICSALIFSFTPWGLVSWTGIPGPTSWREVLVPFNVLWLFGMTSGIAEPLLILLMATGVWTLLMPLTYFVLSETMRTHKVRRAHLLRIAVCSLAAWAMCCGVLMAVCSLIADTSGTFLPNPLEFVREAMIEYHPLLHLAWFIWFILYWWHATRTYLKLPHAVAIVTLMTITAGLATLAVFLVPWLYF